MIDMFPFIHAACKGVLPSRSGCKWLAPAARRHSIIAIWSMSYNRGGQGGEGKNKMRGEEYEGGRKERKEDGERKV